MGDGGDGQIPTVIRGPPATESLKCRRWFCILFRASSSIFVFVLHNEDLRLFLLWYLTQSSVTEAGLGPSAGLQLFDHSFTSKTILRRQRHRNP